MAQARRRSQRQRGAGNGLPGWAMLTIGLVIGLFVAFLVYLDDLEQPPNAQVEAKPQASGEDASASDEAANQQTEADAEGRADGGDGKSGKGDKPRFEFYSILPELEVVVPEGEKGDGGAPDARDEAAGTGDGDTPAASGGPFYLQAGSFQKPKQADRMKAKIALLGLDVAIQEVELDGEQWHRVRVGPYTDKAALDKARQRLRDNGIDFLVLREKQGAASP